MAIKQLNKLRLKFNFTDDNNEKYKNFCKIHRKEKGDLSCVKIEHYIFIMLDNPKLRKKYIRKILKLLNNCDDDLYRNYVLYKIGEVQSIDAHLYRDYPSFLQEIQSRNDKYSAKWHDIDLMFSTEDDLLNFKALKMISNYSYYGEDAYYRKVSNEIIKIELLLKKITVKSKSRNFYENSVDKIIAKSENLQNFLHENLVESQFLNTLINEAKILSIFFKYLKEFEQCEKIDPSPILNFKLPKLFGDLEVEIEKMKVGRKFNQKCLQKHIKNKFSEIFKVDNPIPVPFPPVFYDIANDYIQYPQDKSNIAGLTDLLGKLNLFGRKK
ncbi:hypothetical protein DMUE_1854 [Dictyocoela muelleri]|nr:hypothetical protein DMUE_1854 [Dictyocoela muelleri]